MRRGDLVTIALAGDFAKLRPALIIQSDQFNQTGTVTVLLVSSTLVDAPLIGTKIEPTPTNRLRNSQVMVTSHVGEAKQDQPGYRPSRC